MNMNKLILTNLHFRQNWSVSSSPPHKVKRNQSTKFWVSSSNKQSEIPCESGAEWQISHCL